MCAPNMHPGLELPQSTGQQCDREARRIDIKCIYTPLWHWFVHDGAAQSHLANEYLPENHRCSVGALVTAPQAFGYITPHLVQGQVA